MKKKLPIWIQTFREIIEWDYVYIDKTKEAYELITSYKYVFLSRPRRFWKSLFLDTLKEIFEGNKKLFEWLYIYDKRDWSQKYPVIKISWSWDLRSPTSVNETILAILKDNQKRLGINCENVSNYSICFRQLIEWAYEKYNQKVVILIDEYDKPILDNVDQLEIAKENREILRWLYWVLKDMDPYIRFVFLTWVSKFSKASIFSGLNMLEDITLNPKFWNICGITQEELETQLKEYLEWVDLQKVKRWYNGYNFLKDDVYNPFDLLSFIKNNFRFSNYRFATWNPMFLIKLMEKENFYLPKLSNLEIGETLLESFDITNMKPEVVLFQAWYLTIKEQKIENLWFAETIKYKLKIPNIEIKLSLSEILIDYLTKTSPTTQYQLREELAKIFINWEVEKLEDVIERLFASIPYTNYVRNEIAKYEWYYASVFYVYLQSLGFDIIWEDVNNVWRADLTLIAGSKVYIFEFKVDTNESPLKQIIEKEYYKKYQWKYEEIYLVWINFSSEKRNIEKIEIKKI